MRRFARATTAVALATVFGIAVVGCSSESKSKAGDKMGGKMDDKMGGDKMGGKMDDNKMGK